MIKYLSIFQYFAPVLKKEINTKPQIQKPEFLEEVIWKLSKRLMFESSGPSGSRKDSSDKLIKYGFKIKGFDNVYYHVIPPEGWKQKDDSEINEADLSPKAKFQRNNIFFSDKKWICDSKNEFVLFHYWYNKNYYLFDLAEN